ncbi:hypothetical protein [Candidatus Odyssella thessalonicensis]|uniref:hypothetical protein n=1 Tax=Candidatus Odyssella thessalonicensis TaxID=84647 RepID=UPI000225B790|nr:hypothetical protein [Candidatus Odyssella thessalonicensis]
MTLMRTIYDNSLMRIFENQVANKLENFISYKVIERITAQGKIYDLREIKWDPIQNKKSEKLLISRANLQDCLNNIK